MALRDVTNTYVPSVRLASIYAPVIKRGRIIDERSSRAGFAARRSNGDKNIDLWVDGSLYPVDPATSLHPCFSTLKEYLEFLCHGEGGMLGYTKRLGSAVTSLQSTVRGYESDIQCLRQQHEECRRHIDNLTSTASLLGHERERLISELVNSEATCTELRISLLAAAEGFRESVVSLQTELSKSKSACEDLQAKMKYMVETPRGLRKRVHTSSMKNVDELAPGSLTFVKYFSSYVL